ncbi:13984_t:CDS:2, partial [Dentiscutata heterogama]
NILTSSNKPSYSDSSNENLNNTEEEIIFSSTVLQTQETQKKTNQPHPPVKCKYCPKKYKHGLATHMQKHTNICSNLEFFNAFHPSFQIPSDILQIDEIKLIIEDSKTVVKYFKNHNIAIAKLRRIQKENYNKEIALVLPALTR